METVQIDGRDIWAGFLINGDTDGLSDEDFKELQAWLAFHGKYDHDCLSAGDDTFFGQPDMPNADSGMLLTYTFAGDEG